MKKISARFLQLVVMLGGFVALGLLLWEPHLEGRNAGASFFEVYTGDPFLVYVYLASLPFFIALYEAYKVLGYFANDTIFSLSAVKSVRKIRYCAFITAGLIAAAELFLVIYSRLYVDLSEVDGPEGVIVLGAVAICITLVVGVMMVLFERVLQEATDRQSENTLNS